MRSETHRCPKCLNYVTVDAWTGTGSCLEWDVCGWPGRIPNAGPITAGPNKPEPEPEPVVAIDQQLRQQGAPVLPGFERL